VAQCSKFLLTPLRNAIAPGQKNICLPSWNLQDSSVNFLELECNKAEITIFDGQPLSINEHTQIPMACFNGQQDEVNAQEQCQDACPSSLGDKAVTCKWVFMNKEEIVITGDQEHAAVVHQRLIYHLIAIGFQQEAGYNYTNIFAPVVKWTTIFSVQQLLVPVSGT
jgi:hypothetical protein